MHVPLAYLHGSMKVFRSHITRIYGFVLLLLGIGLNVANISEQNVKHAAFTSWLGSHLKNSDSEAQEKLDHLSTVQSELEDVIRLASEVVTSHVEDFELPVNSSDDEPDSDQVYHLLLTQWNQFQHSEAGMGKAVLIEHAKPLTILPNDGKYSQNDGINLKTVTPNSELFHSSNAEVLLISSYFLSPNESGIAIGAP